VASVLDFPEVLYVFRHSLSSLLPDLGEFGNSSFRSLRVVLGMELIFELPQVRIESGTSDAYHPKAGPIRDWPKNRTLNGSDTEIIPSCIKYRLTCSMELAPSDPLNLVNSGSRYLGGSGIKS